jgi:aspartyl protease family protein
MLKWRPNGGLQEMRAVLFFLGLVTVLCTVASRYIDVAFLKPGTPTAMAVTEKQAKPAEPVASGYRTVTLRSERGQFQVEASVDGRRIEFIVDTGASMIALRESSAARLGIFPRVSDYTVRTQTANGVGKAAPTMLNRIEINGITVRDVQAFVVPDNQLAVNLLGMSFLSRIKWSHDRGRLVLEQ